ncbi:MAG: response regulator [Anaerolineales bacterium]|nr:response regulator [Anaerolineales bacterium]
MAQKILIVDDDPETVRMVKLMLDKQGYTVVTASDGDQAISLSQIEQPDLVLLDIMMPDIDGYEVTQKLRGDASTSNIPIIMFTAKTQLEDKLLAFDVGADDFISKPSQPRELFAHIKAVLARASRQLPHISIGKSANLIGITAVKGGLGVTTLALNLGVAIKQLSKAEVVVVEFRPGQGRIGLELNYPTQSGLIELLNRSYTNLTKSDVESQLATHDSGIHLLLSSHLPTEATVQAASHPFELITRQLTNLSGHILIDLGPSLSPITNKVIKYCNQIILVVEPTPQCAVQSKAMMMEIINTGFSSDQIHVVLVNRVSSSLQLSWTQFQEQSGLEIACVFSAAPDLSYLASINHIPMVLHNPESPTADQFQQLASLVIQ